MQGFKVSYKYLVGNTDTYMMSILSKSGPIILYEVYDSTCRYLGIRVPEYVDNHVHTEYHDI
jgi:hypothetical protein